ncbi:MAG TPA: hydrogenase maturation nickel metallochaperone HypA [Humisphaera sp.]|nr:hydrogenase maturation nickel metallochaperone HypA [Humisphaera sp.]
MHELSIAMSILDVAGEEAERLNAKVIAIRLKLGPLSGVVKEALLSAYDLARENSLLPDARLEIEETPLVVFCPVCKSDQRPPSIQHLCCPTCGAPTPDVIGGRELEVVGLEIVDDDANTDR